MYYIEMNIWNMDDSKDEYLKKSRYSYFIERYIVGLDSKKIPTCWYLKTLNLRYPQRKTPTRVSGI